MRSNDVSTQLATFWHAAARLPILTACAAALMVLTADLPAGEQTRPRRFIYNSDGNHMYLYKPPPMSVADLESYVDEVVGTGVTTFFASPNWGMLPAYPSQVTEMMGTQLPSEQMAKIRATGREKDRSSERAITNLHAVYDAGHDPFGVMIDRAREKDLEIFISFRLNEIHDVQNPESLIVSKFWRAHPEWRVGKHGDKISPLFAEIIGGREDHPVHPIVASWFPGALNFAVPEVRALRLAELRECCERYAIDGLDLDFQRFPIYFPQSEGRKHVETMTSWMREVRAMTREVGQKRGRPLLLSARVLAKPEQNLAIGLNPVGWAHDGLVDFIVVSHYLRNDFPLPIGQFRERLPETMPLYASIEVEPKADNFRRIARQLYDDGVDGLMMFNYFTTRERGVEPDFGLFTELSDPARLKPVSP
jgi:hypothetical protein